MSATTSRATDAPLPASHTILHAVPLGEKIRSFFALDTPFNCELLHRGMNDFYVVRSAGRQYAARVWRPMSRPASDVDYEIDFLIHLDEGGVPVPTPRRGRDGSNFMPVEGADGNRATALFAWAYGRPFSANPTLAASRRMGEIFGQLHLRSMSYKPKKERVIDRTRNIQKGAPLLAELVAHRPDDVALYRRVGEELLARYEAVRQSGADLPMGTVQGDFHIHNAFVTDDGTITIMDFDACGRDYFVQELMSYKWSIEKNNLDPRLWDVFLAGYESVRLLTDAEHAHMPLFLVGKEFQYLNGFAISVNAIGHAQFFFPGFEWFAASTRKHVAEARLF